MQAWLQPMHARMSSANPSRAFAGIAGSQIRARVMAQASACPAAMIFSASWGWLIRPATMTGTPTTFLIAAANGAVYAAGRDMGGAMCTAPERLAELPAHTLT